MISKLGEARSRMCVYVCVYYTSWHALSRNFAGGCWPCYEISIRTVSVSRNQSNCHMTMDARDTSVGCVANAICKLFVDPQGEAWRAYACWREYLRTPVVAKDRNRPNSRYCRYVRNRIRVKRELEFFVLFFFLLLFFFFFFFLLFD